MDDESIWKVHEYAMRQMCRPEYINYIEMHLCTVTYKWKRIFFNWAIKF